MKKLIHSFGLRSSAAGLALLLVLGNAGVANAQTNGDLQAQINALLAQIAALQASVGTTASVTFTRDLTLGSSGAEVTALQNWLISKGFSISAGATGYFGAQTKAALATYQASVGITPTAGYFGPTTRAKINASAGNGTGTGSSTGGQSGNGSTSSSLKGGEADLRDYKLVREELAGGEGEEGVEAATATFDVEDGDIRVERLELLASAKNFSLGVQPWKYFDSVSILANGKEIAGKDVDSRNDWSEVRKGEYRLTLTSLAHVVREGDTAELTIAFDISDSIDSGDLDQEFDLSIEDRGIRAVDAAGIQQYVGSEDDTVTFGFSEEESGDLNVRSSNDDPSSSVLISDEDRESGEYEVFVFEIKNGDDADSVIDELAINVTDLGMGIDADDVIRKATLSVDGDEFIGDVGTSTIAFDDMDLTLDGNDTHTFTLMVRLARNAPATSLAFDVQSAGVEAEGARSGDTSEVSGSARSAEHQVAQSGIVASNGKTTATAESSNGVRKGQYSITFDVEALEETVYLSRSADTATSTQTAGVAYTVYRGSEAVQLTSGEVTDFLQAARSDNGDTAEYFIVREGQTRTFTLRVTVSPDTAGYYSIELSELRFDTDRDGVSDDSSYEVPSIREFRTDAEQLNP